MICDVLDLQKFLSYAGKNGPFVITFYKEDRDRKNYILYKNLKKLEKEFCEVPILRFDYDEFTKFNHMQNVPSPMHLLIIAKDKENILIEASDISCIRKVLEDIAKTRLLDRKNVNKEFKNLKKHKLKPWVIYSSSHTLEVINKQLQKPAKTQYKFPNNTIIFNTIKKSEKTKNESQNVKKSSPKPKVSKFQNENIHMKSRTCTKETTINSNSANTKKSGNSDLNRLQTELIPHPYMDSNSYQYSLDAESLNAYINEFKRKKTANELISKREISLKKVRIINNFNNFSPKIVNIFIPYKSTQTNTTQSISTCPVKITNQIQPSYSQLNQKRISEFI